MEIGNDNPYVEANPVNEFDNTSEGLNSNRPIHQIPPAHNEPYYEEEDEIPEQFLMGIPNVTPRGSKFWLPKVDVDIKPFIGKTFNNIDEAFRFYKNYGDKGGFEVRKYAQTRMKDNSIKLKWYVCSREGTNPNQKVDTLVDGMVIEENEENEESAPNKVTKKQRRRRASQRIGCEACIRVEITPNGKYETYTFVEEHNHPLVHPEYRIHLKSARRLDYSKKILLHNLGDAGIGPVVGHRVLTKVYGGHENVGASKTDSKNYKRDVNAFIAGADAHMVIKMLKNKRATIPDFSFDYFTDDGGDLGGVFWADEEAKKNYFAFGDVVSFDATFRSNKYDMVFIPFTGIDNHFKCVTFGGGLLTKEDLLSYEWLLKTFKSAYPREPKLLLTDQDPAMKQAILSRFVHARHRLCMWHITEKLTSKVGASICRGKEGFKAQISRIVWTDKLEPEVFDVMWLHLLTKFNVLDV